MIQAIAKPVEHLSGVDHHKELLYAMLVVFTSKREMHHGLPT
jgi:hypothetical protein